jgi:RNA 3'-terminal phosphate cyclase (ATP)
MLEINGAYEEGGGQILRTSIALSAITGTPVRVYNIRRKRSRPGLAPQHLNAVKAVAMMTDAEVSGMRIGSDELIFRPKTIKSGEFHIDIGTAGSITLIIQALLPVALLATGKTSFTITGGTDVQWSPTVDYLQNITLRALKEMGCSLRIDLARRGYYPKGGGMVIMSVEPSSIKGVHFYPVNEMIKGISHCSNLPHHVAERQARAARKVFEEEGFKSRITWEKKDVYSTGSGITLWSGWKGSSSLGEKGKKAEIVGKEAAKTLLEEINNDFSCDRHLADQLMVFGVLGKGVTVYSTSTITKHCRSNAYVIEQFLDGVIRMYDNIIEIKGIGL